MNKYKQLTIILTLLSFSIILSSSFAFALSTVNLGTANNFSILSKSGISTNETTIVNGDIKIDTNLSVEVEEGHIILTESNGTKDEIKIMPSLALAISLERLDLKTCSQSNECTIMLKEVETENQTKLVYELEAQKDVKVLGIFNTKTNVQIDIDAQTNETIRANVPWAVYF